MTAISEKLEKCGICLEEKNPETMARLSPCNHLFDEACIDQWHNTDRNNCPLCRGRVIELNVNGEIRSIANPMENFPLQIDGRTIFRLSMLGGFVILVLASTISQTYSRFFNET